MRLKSQARLGHIINHEHLPEESEGKDRRDDVYFPRMLDKIRLHARGELGEEYHANLGKPRAADGACTNFLRVNYPELCERVAEGGTDEEILEWCYKNGRQLNEDDLVVWNGFLSKLGWNDFASPNLDRGKKECGATERADIQTVGDLIDFDEKRLA